MRKITLLSSAAAAAGLLAVLPAAHALVSPGTTFNFDVLAFNLASGDSVYSAPIETATFGATSTFLGVGFDGQNITISSTETVGATTTTDTFTVSTPTNFITDTSINGELINGLQFDLGDVNTGGAVAVATTISTYSDAGSTVYGTGNTATLPPNTFLAADGNSYGAAEGVQSSPDTIAISTYAFQSFTYSITYNTIPTAIPEPATWAMLGVGCLAGVVALRRRTVGLN